MPGVQTYTLIDQTTLSSSAASVTFSSIPQIYEDLVLEFVGTTASNSNMYIRFNGDSGSNYSRTFMFGDGSAASSGRDSNQTHWYGFYGATSIGTQFAQIMSYSNTSVNKTALNSGAISTVAANINVGLWRSTAAITSISITGETANVSAGSTFRLYGLVG